MTVIERVTNQVATINIKARQGETPSWQISAMIRCRLQIEALMRSD